MIVGTVIITLYAPWVRSLKEKRMIVQSLIKKARNRFNISIAEIEETNKHQSIVLGISCVSNNTNHVNSILTEVVNFLESNTEAEIVDVQMEII